MAQESEAGLLYFGLYLFDPQDGQILPEGQMGGRDAAGHFSEVQLRAILFDGPNVCLETF